MRNKFIHYPLVMALMLLFCVPCVTVTYAQSFTVTGTVTDSQGGIPGANVKVKGGTAGTITNMDGQFTLSVPSSKSILVVSYIGYTPQEVAINGKNKLDIHLLEDTKTLDEVVVVGYGVQKKSHLTGSVSKMDINNLTDIPVTQVDQLLQGKIAGTRQTEHILCFQERTVRTAIDFGSHHVLTLLQIRGDIKISGIARILGETHILAVNP